MEEITETDAAMIKLFAYKRTRMNKDTIIMLKFDATANFDRMYHKYRNMLDTKKKVDHTICKCMSLTMKRAIRNVETGLGMLDATYKQRRGEKTTTGEIKGKAPIPQSSNFQKDQMIQVHNKLSKGVELHTPNMKRKMAHHGVSLFDD